MVRVVLPSFKNRVGVERPAGYLDQYSLAGIMTWLGHHSLGSGPQFYWLKNLIFVLEVI